MTDTGKLAGLCALYPGMKIKVTMKILPPEVVQESTGEVLTIGFHEKEQFGLPTRQQDPGGMFACIMFFGSLVLPLGVVVLLLSWHPGSS